MDVRNCRSCGRLFNYMGGGPNVCPDCVKELENKFHEVKEYIRSNPKAAIGVVAEENGVTVKQIKQWVREERLEFSAESQVALECESCGKMIRVGRFCDECKDKVKNEMESMITKKVVATPQKKKSDGNKMRFLDN